MVNKVKKKSFKVKLQSEEGRNMGGETEQVSWISFNKITSGNMRVGTTDGVNHDWHTLDFQNGENGGSPDFFAAAQTRNGGNTFTLRYNSLNSDGAQVFVEEERSR